MALGHHRRRMVAGSLSAALVVALLTGPASADSIGSTQARASQLAAQIAAGAAKIRLLDTRYYRVSDQSAAASSQLAQIKAQLEHNRRRFDASRAVLRAEALTAYVSGRLPAATGAVADLVVRGEYLRLATGTVTDAVDQLRANAASLRISEAKLYRSQQAARAAADQVVLARQAALAEAHSLQAQLDQVQGQLAVLVADAQAAEQAARQRAAAMRAEQLALVAASQARPPQGLPVNGGLVATVQDATSGGGGAGGVWARLRQCESGGNYAENTGNGYYGAYQFSQATWTSLGYPGRPDLAPPAMQDEAAQKLQAVSGWSQWAACSAILGLT